MNNYNKEKFGIFGRDYQYLGFFSFYIFLFRYANKYFDKGYIPINALVYYDYIFNKDNKSMLNPLEYFFISHIIIHLKK